ncbi:hypothetical protein KSS87_016933, partial [Heliosperma pusillum]
HLVHLALVLCVWYIWQNFSAFGTSGTIFVRLVHLGLVLCVWYIWHNYGASGTSV